MHLISARNVNSALESAAWWLHVAGTREQSRNGEVIVAPGPVMTIYREPQERVLFHVARDANPFFHLMEALWMLAGRDDLAWPLQFNSRFSEFSDDGKTIHGAYGRRWRSYFGREQLYAITTELREHPESRRAVLTMWDPGADLSSTSRDIPCNTHAYFDLRGGVLNMTVCCRSNDILWGAYGANVVHFSILQEYLAYDLRAPIGAYRQFSNNLHLYTAIAPLEDFKLGERDLYTEGIVRPSPLIQENSSVWDKELLWFLEDPLGDTAYREPFFGGVAAPMYAAWHDRKTKRGSGRSAAEAITASDWRQACLEWIDRREAAKNA